MKFPENVGIIYNGVSLTIVTENGDYIQVDSTQSNFSDALAAYRENDYEKFLEVVRPVTKIERELKEINGVTVDAYDGVVSYQGKELHNEITKRIIICAREAIPFDNLANFLIKVKQNPSKQITDELFQFLNSSSTPVAILPNGNFLAYKRVRSDFKDCYTGTIDNSVGTVVSMNRNEVDDVRTNTCSQGLHFCSLEYLPHYWNSNNTIVLIVEIDPSDVVSIPIDYNNQKGRTSKYKVVGIHKETLIGNESVGAFEKEFVSYDDLDDDLDLETEYEIHTLHDALTDDNKLVDWVNPVNKDEHSFIRCSSREDARVQAKRNNGKVIDMFKVNETIALEIEKQFGELTDNRWYAMTSY